MKKKAPGLAGALCLFLIACQPEVDYAKEGPKVSAQDFFAIEGEWVGTLTYTDYSSGVPIEIAANVSVTLISDNRIDYTISYPGEPWEDSESTMTISKDGRLLDGQVVSDRITAEDGTLIVTTRYRGEDDNRPADIQQTYGLSEKTFYIRKDVQFDDSDTSLLRNIYAFTR
jgi:hypothetical protein